MLDVLEAEGLNAMVAAGTVGVSLQRNNEIDTFRIEFPRRVSANSKHIQVMVAPAGRVVQNAGSNPNPENYSVIVAEKSADRKEVIVQVKLRHDNRGRDILINQLSYMCIALKD